MLGFGILVMQETDCALSPCSYLNIGAVRYLNATSDSCHSSVELRWGKHCKLPKLGRIEGSCWAAEGL